MTSKTDRYKKVQSLYLQMRQLSSGFMTFKGEDDNKVQIAFDNNPKLDELIELIDNIPNDKKIIVFHHFVYTNHLICKALKKNKIKHTSVYGGTKDKIGNIRFFKDNKDCRVLVINSKSGSSSQNLQLANYIVFFEEPDSPIDREQAERRAWRPGQENKVNIIDLIVKGTADEKMYRYNKEGRDLLKAVLDGKELL